MPNLVEIGLWGSSGKMCVFLTIILYYINICINVKNAVYFCCFLCVTDYVAVIICINCSFFYFDNNIFSVRCAISPVGTLR